MLAWAEDRALLEYDRRPCGKRSQSRAPSLGSALSQSFAYRIRLIPSMPLDERVPPGNPYIRSNPWRPHRKSIVALNRRN
jgi:hypothetical protein